jgi:hypothetical protein
MDAGAGGLLSSRQDRREACDRIDGRCPQESAADGRSKMDDRGPMHRSFLAFVIIVTIAVLALAVAIYPHP